MRELCNQLKWKSQSKKRIQALVLRVKLVTDCNG